MTSARDRIDELLLGEAVGSLSKAEQAELETLLAQHEGIDRYAYERAATAFFVGALARPEEAMPSALRERLLGVADEL
jgi:hypothetical protein